MPAKKKKTTVVRTAKKSASTDGSLKAAPRSLQDQVNEALLWLEQKSTARDRENLARFGIMTNKAFGVSMTNMQALAKRLGRNHDLAAALWETGWYEARSVAALVDDPESVTPAQMDRWCRDFDNWAICDTVCFKLFDRVPHAWAKVTQWSEKRDEFQKRAAFALLACLGAHDKSATDLQFLESLPLVERAASDERNFVKKGVSWALRMIGRRNLELNVAATAVARRLADSPQSAARWVGKDALREFASAVVIRQLAARRNTPRAKEMR